MNNKIFELTMRRKNAFVLEKDIVSHEHTEETDTAIKELNAAINSLGYQLEDKAVELLSTIHPVEINAIKNELMMCLCELKGIDKKMIENEKSNMKAIEKTKESSDKEDSLINLRIFTQRDVQQMVCDMLSSKVVLSKSDREDIKTIFDTYKNFDVFPEEIPMKENMAFLALLTYEVFGSVSFVVPYVKTATDALRVMTAVSGGDISLAERTKYISLRRKDRRLLLDCLNKAKNLEEDMARYASNWKRVGEILHPGEFAAKYPVAFEAFKKIRENQPIASFMGEFDKLCNRKQFEAAAVYLSKRPGELARKMDYLIRSANDKDLVIDTFKKVADRVDSPILVQLHNHFRYRNDLEYKMIIPKSSRSKYHLLENTKEAIDPIYCDKMVACVEAAMIEVLRKKEPIGKVYLSEDVKGYIVPYAMRTASKALKTVARGSRFKLDDSVKWVKLFCYWKDSELNDYGTDIDLSAVFYSEEFDKQLDIYYNNTHCEFAKHSGDILEAPNGDWEFVDVNIDEAIACGFRYMAMSLNNFNRETFSRLPECFAGWAAVNDAGGNDCNAKDIQNRFDLTSNALTTIPIVLDLKTREIIWADTDINSSSLEINNVESNKNPIQFIMKGIIDIKKMDLYDLFSLNVKARGGVLVDSKEEADVVFSLTEGITPFDYEKIMTEFL